MILKSFKCLILFSNCGQIKQDTKSNIRITHISCGILLTAVPQGTPRCTERTALQDGGIYTPKLLLRMPWAYQLSPEIAFSWRAASLKENLHPMMVNKEGSRPGLLTLNLDQLGRAASKSLWDRLTPSKDFIAASSLSLSNLAAFPFPQVWVLIDWPFSC